MQNDELDCKVSAVKDVPAAMKTETSPGYWVPKKGDRDGYWVPGSSYSVDVNAGLRKDIIDRCMSRRGYQAIEVPQCTDTGPATIATGHKGRMAPLTANSCAVRASKSGWIIVNPSR